MEGRQYGRGRSGGQVRDEYRAEFDAGRGGLVDKSSSPHGGGGGDRFRRNVYRPMPAHAVQAQQDGSGGDSRADASGVDESRKQAKKRGRDDSDDEEDGGGEKRQRGGGDEDGNGASNPRFRGGDHSDEDV